MYLRSYNNIVLPLVLRRPVVLQVLGVPVDPAESKWLETQLNEGNYILQHLRLTKKEFKKCMIGMQLKQYFYKVMQGYSKKSK